MKRFLLLFLFGAGLGWGQTPPSILEHPIALDSVIITPADWSFTIIVSTPHYSDSGDWTPFVDTWEFVILPDAATISLGEQTHPIDAEEAKALGHLMELLTRYAKLSVRDFASDVGRE